MQYVEDQLSVILERANIVSAFGDPTSGPSKSQYIVEPSALLMLDPRVRSSEPTPDSDSGLSPRKDDGSIQIRYFLTSTNPGLRAYERFVRRKPLPGATSEMGQMSVGGERTA
jgi:hypothetical protein